jgi:hypothetical protein
LSLLLNNVNSLPPLNLLRADKTPSMKRAALRTTSHTQQTSISTYNL